MEVAARKGDHAVIVTSFPDWVEPMAATLTQDRFTGPEWIFERKFDGIRLLAFKQGPDVRLFSRNRLPQHIPAVAEAIAQLPVDDAILDGEVDVGRQAVVSRLRRHVARRPRRHRRCRSTSAARCCAICRCRRRSQRVELLDDPRPWERASCEGWEGVIAKRRDSLYEHRRSPHWLKMKCEADAGARRRRIHRARRANGSVSARCWSATSPTCHPRRTSSLPARSGRGSIPQLLLDLRARLDRLEIPKPPFTKAEGTAAPARALGQSGNRRAGRLHRMDGARQASPSAIARGQIRQGGP